MLQKLHPSRRAARELRQRHGFVLLNQGLVETDQQLGAFLNDGEVGREVGVEDLVESAQAQRRVHLERQRLARLKAEALADARARARGSLDHDVLGRVVNGRPDLVGRVVRPQRAGRAAVDALSAVDADDLAQRLVNEGFHFGRLGAAGHFQHADLLQINAGAHAAAAEDALVHVAHDGVAGAVNLKAGFIGMPEAEEVYAVLLGQRLQLAVVVAGAGVAFPIVLREQQVEDVPPGLAHLAGVRADGDGRGDGISAGCLKCPLPLHLDGTDAADAGHTEILVIAQRRNVNVQLLRGLQNRGAHRHLDLLVVNCDRDGRADGLLVLGRGELLHGTADGCA